MWAITAAENIDTVMAGVGMMVAKIACRIYDNNAHAPQKGNLDQILRPSLR